MKKYDIHMCLGDDKGALRVVRKWDKKSDANVGKTMSEDAKIIYNFLRDYVSVGTYNRLKKLIDEGK